jgi:hypothetical protein
VTPQNRAGGQAERALCAPEDVHQSLKEFSATDSVANNDAFAAEPRKARHKEETSLARELAALWDRTFDF